MLNRSESKNKNHFSAQAYGDDVNNSVDRTGRIRRNSEYRSGGTDIDACKQQHMSSSISQLTAGLSLNMNKLGEPSMMKQMAKIQGNLDTSIQSRQH